MWVEGNPVTGLALEHQEDAAAVFTAANTWQLIKDKEANALFSEDYLIPKGEGKQNSPYSMMGCLNYVLKKSAKKNLVSIFLFLYCSQT